MTKRYIFRDNKKYFYYDTFKSWRDAYNQGRYLKRNFRCHYWIDSEEGGYFIVSTRYHLYVTHA